MSRRCGGLPNWRDCGSRTGEESDVRQSQLSEIVDYIDQLRAFDDDDASHSKTAWRPVTPPTTRGPRPANDVGPADKEGRPLLDDFLDNAPASLDRFLLVPQVKATPGGDGVMTTVQLLKQLAAAVRSGERNRRRDRRRRRSTRIEEVDWLRSVRFSNSGANEADRARIRDRSSGRDAGLKPWVLLAGVPTALKDNLSLAGHELNCGSQASCPATAPPIPPGQSNASLAADAVPVGRVNMDEFAMGSSCENSALAVDP